MKSIIINTAPEETRMALMADNELLAIEVERSAHSHLVGNIYKGHVQNVLPGMQAAFVDIGSEKNAFLYIGDGLPKDALEAVPRQAKIHIGQNLPRTAARAIFAAPREPGEPDEHARQRERDAGRSADGVEGL